MLFTSDVTLLRRSQEEKDVEKFNQIISVRTLPNFYFFLIWFSFTYKVTIRYLIDETPHGDKKNPILSEIVIWHNVPPMRVTLKEFPFKKTRINVTLFSIGGRNLYMDNNFTVCAMKSLSLKQVIDEEMPPELRVRRNVLDHHPKFHQLLYVRYCKIWNDYQLGYYPLGKNRVS